ncbi:MAG: glycosyltransferase family 4 protein [Candidatus Limnocylindrales bacterium]
MAAQTFASTGKEPLTIGIVGDQESVHIERWSTALRARGHTVVPIDLSGRERSPLQRIGAFRDLRRAMAAVAHARLGLIAIHGVPDGILATGVRGLHPVVLHAWGHDVTAETSGLRGRVRGHQQRGLFRAADAATATSQFLADVLARRFGVRAEVIPFGIDTDRFGPAGGARRPGPVRIGFVKWRLGAKYGPDVLVEALGLLPAGTDFEVTFAGDEGLRPMLEARLGELNLTDKVRFIGRLPNSEVATLLSGLDILAMPSRREEWGVAAAEASASGLAVVATRVGGIPEIVVDGETGLLVPPEDPAALAKALERLIADPGLRSRLGRAGRRRIEELFRWEGCVDRMELVYRRAVEARSPAGRPGSG